MQAPGKHSRVQEPSCLRLGWVGRKSVLLQAGADVMVGGNATAPSLQERHSPLNGTLRATATHVGKSPDCSNLGLGVLKISIAVSKGADVMAGAPAQQGRHPTCRITHQVLCSCTCILHSMGYPSKNWAIPILTTNPDFSQLIWVYPGISLNQQVVLSGGPIIL